MTFSLDLGVHHVGAASNFSSHRVIAAGSLSVALTILGAVSRFARMQRYRNAEAALCQPDLHLPLLMITIACYQGASSRTRSSCLCSSRMVTVIRRHSPKALSSADGVCTLVVTG